MDEGICAYIFILEVGCVFFVDVLVFLLSR